MSSKNNAPGSSNGPTLERMIQAGKDLNAEKTSENLEKQEAEVAGKNAVRDTTNLKTTVAKNAVTLDDVRAAVARHEQERYPAITRSGDATRPTASSSLSSPERVVRNLTGTGWAEQAKPSEAARPSLKPVPLPDSAGAEKPEPESERDLLYDDPRSVANNETHEPGDLSNLPNLSQVGWDEKFGPSDDDKAPSDDKTSAAASAENTRDNDRQTPSTHLENLYDTPLPTEEEQAEIAEQKRQATQAEERERSLYDKLPPTKEERAAQARERERILLYDPRPAADHKTQEPDGAENGEQNGQGSVKIIKLTPGGNHAPATASNENGADNGDHNDSPTTKAHERAKTPEELNARAKRLINLAAALNFSRQSDNLTPEDVARVQREFDETANDMSPDELKRALIASAGRSSDNKAHDANQNTPHDAVNNFRTRIQDEAGKFVASDSNSDSELGALREALAQQGADILESSQLDPNSDEYKNLAYQLDAELNKLDATIATAREAAKSGKTGKTADDQPTRVLPPEPNMKKFEDETEGYTEELSGKGNFFGRKDKDDHDATEQENRAFSAFSKALRPFAAGMKEDRDLTPEELQDVAKIANELQQSIADRTNEKTDKGNFLRRVSSRIGNMKGRYKVIIGAAVSVGLGLGFGVGGAVVSVPMTLIMSRRSSKRSQLNKTGNMFFATEAERSAHLAQIKQLAAERKKRHPLANLLSKVGDKQLDDKESTFSIEKIQSDLRKLAEQNPNDQDLKAGPALVDRIANAAFDADMDAKNVDKYNNRKQTLIAAGGAAVGSIIGSGLHHIIFDHNVSAIQTQSQPHVDPGAASNQAALPPAPGGTQLPTQLDPGQTVNIGGQTYGSRDLIAHIIRGDFGNGQTRADQLGPLNDWAQGQVNENMARNMLPNGIVPYDSVQIY